MAQFKAIIRISEHFKNTDGKYNVKIRLSHKGATRYISTNHYIDCNQIDPDTGSIIKHPNAALLNIDIQQTILEYQKILLKEGERVNLMSCQQVIEMLILKPDGELDFFTYANNINNQLLKEKRINTAQSYKYAVLALKNYTGTEILPFSQITPKLLKDFEVSCRMKDQSINGIGIYLRSIRAIYNRAVNDELISFANYPFRRFKIRKEATIKRSLTLRELSAIKNIELKGNANIARDVFMLSFYLIGINMKDLLSVVYDGKDRIVYSRSKTHKPYSIKVWPEAKILLEKYRIDNTLYFMGASKDYRHTVRLINDYLKEVIITINKDDEFKPKIDACTTYFARHSWATVAASLDIPKEIISHGLGHGNNSVTDIYINFDLSKVDEANRRVIEAVNSY